MGTFLNARCGAHHGCSLLSASRLPIFSTTRMRSSCAARGIAFPPSHRATDSVEGFARRAARRQAL